MPQRFVTVHRTYDAIEAEIVRDLLVEDGVAARLLGGGTRPAALFGPATEIEARIDVPADDAPRAERLVAEHLAAAREAVEDVDGDESAPAPAAERPLRHVLAAGVVGICPGGAHFYARRPMVGFAILAGQIAALGTLFAGGGGSGPAAVVAAALLLADLVGGQLAVRAWNRGVRASRPRQSVHGALLLAGAGAMAVMFGPLLERLPGRRSRSERFGERQEIRRAIEHPRDLPFPLYLDLRR